MPDENVPDTTAIETQPDSFLTAWSSRFDLPEGVKTSDDLASMIENTIGRSNLIQDGEDENALRDMREARAWRYANADKMTAFENWQAEQSAAPTPTYSPSQQSADDYKPRYQPMKVDSSLLQYLERDPDTGMFRAKLPELAPRASQVNGIYQQRQQFIEDLYSQPDEVISHLAHPAIQAALKPILDRLTVFEQQMTPIQQSQQMSALMEFESYYRDLLYAPSITTPQTKDDWTLAGQKYLELVDLGMQPEQAVAFVSNFAPAAPTQTPVDVKKTFLQHAKAVTRSTGQPTEAAGTVATALATGATQNTGKVTRAQKWRQAQQEAERELLEQG